MSFIKDLQLTKKNSATIELSSSEGKPKSLGEKEKQKSLSNLISDLSKSEIIVSEVSEPNFEEKDVEVKELETNYMYLAEVEDKAFNFNYKVRTVNVQQPILKNLTSDNPFEQACLDFYQQNLYNLQYEENTSIKVPTEGEFKDFKLVSKREEVKVHPNDFFSL